VGPQQRLEFLEGAAVKRYLTGILPLAVLSLLLIGALFMMSAAAQNSAIFGRMYSLLLVINILGIALLLGLILLNLWHLIRQYRARVMGSRLTLRLLGMFVALAVLPVSVVFFFSIQTLNRGIDNWFDVKIEQALDDALLLGRTSLDAIKQDLVKSAHEMALELESSSSRTALPTLNYLREVHGVTELTLFAQDGRIIAASSGEWPESATLLPDRPSDAILGRVRQGQDYANLDASPSAGLRMRVLVPVYSRDVGAPIRILQLLQALPSRYAKLGESVQTAYAEYEKLVYLRGPLKFSFTLTLSLVALLTMLIALWAAIFSARRVVAPIRELAAGTRAVALGDYKKRIPVTSHDEIGILVESFNEMTRQIYRAQSQIKRASREAEMQRTYLETVLTHLSSGVLSFDHRHILRAHNAAARHVLGADIRTGDGSSLASLAEAHAYLKPFVEAVENAVRAGKREWQAEVVITPEPGARRTLILRGTLLPGSKGRHGGYVVVFDDVTALIQAQRAAAWGEVARRMAHEIKNPLTPIQLSAERIRHKFLRVVPEDGRETLNRATQTIVEQVEALKALVNAFADYARPTQIQTAPVDLNGLVRDVVELYRAERGPSGLDVVPLRGAEQEGGRAENVTLKLELAKDLPSILADPGRLRQVLHNLLLNARDALAGHPKPVTRITTHMIGDGDAAQVELVVRDNGPGFPEELMERLFEPYVTSKARGTGLGLAIVKRIVEEHNGQIAAGRGPDGGATVSIRLPLSHSAVRAPEPVASPSAPARRAQGDQGA
jgi:nitrogen fixation/metabolism regulation signal transduction histidine kinase